MTVCWQRQSSRFLYYRALFHYKIVPGKTNLKSMGPTMQHTFKGKRCRKISAGNQSSRSFNGLGPLTTNRRFLPPSHPKKRFSQKKKIAFSQRMMSLRKCFVFKKENLGLDKNLLNCSPENLPGFWFNIYRVYLTYRSRQILVTELNAVREEFLNLLLPLGHTDFS